MGQSNLKERTSKGIFWSVSSSGIRQVISILIGLVLLKFLSPGDYGLVGMLAIFISIAGILQEGGFISALVNRKEYSSRDYDSVFWITAACGSVIYLILFFCAPLIASFFSQPELVSISRVLFLSLLFSSLGIAQSAYLKKFILQKEFAIVDLAATIVASIAAVFLAVKGFAYWALVANTVVYSFVSTSMRWLICSWKPSFNFDTLAVKEMFGFSFKLIFSSLITQFSQNLYSVIIGKYSTETQLGYYTQGNKWMKMLSSVFTSMAYNVGQPVLRESELSGRNESEVFRKILRCVVFINTPCILGFAFISSDFISLINPDFLPSVKISYIVSLLNIILPVTTLMRVYIISHEKSQWDLCIATISAVILISSVIATAKHGIYWIAAGVTASEYVICLVYLAFLRKISTISIWKVLKDTVPFVAITMVSILIAYFITRSFTNHLILLISKIVITAIVYAAIMYLLDAKVMKETLAFIKARKNPTQRQNQ